MLRINLLRRIPEGHHAAPAHPPVHGHAHHSDHGRRARHKRRHSHGARRSRFASRLAWTTLAGLVIAGVVGLYFIRPERLRPPPPAPQATPRPEARILALEEEASRVILNQQSAVIRWLYELEHAMPSGMVFSLVAFTQPGEFQLRGTAPSGAALRTFQEALLQIPGLEFKESRAGPAVRNPGSFDFEFGGSVPPPPEAPLPGVNRVVPTVLVEARLEEFLSKGEAAGLDFGEPVPGNVTLGTLLAHPYRVVAAAGFEQLRPFLEAQRHEGSPFGIRRAIVENRGGQRRIYLDIMAFAR